MLIRWGWCIPQSGSCRGKKVTRKILRWEESCSKSGFASIWGNVSQLASCCSMYTRTAAAAACTLTHTHTHSCATNEQAAFSLGDFSTYTFLSLHLHFIAPSLLPHLLFSHDSISPPVFRQLTCVTHKYSDWKVVNPNTHTHKCTHLYANDTQNDKSPLPNTRRLKCNEMRTHTHTSDRRLTSVNTLAQDSVTPPVSDCFHLHIGWTNESVILKHHRLFKMR